MRAGTTFHWRRRALLASVSAWALLAAGELSPAVAGQAPALSPAGLSQAAAQHSAQVSAQASGPLLNPAAQAQAALSAANLARAAQAFKAITGAQAAAAAASQLTANGVPLSGLVPVDDHDPTHWINANPLQKDTATATATVEQTAANALLEWAKFDLFTGETLVFDQHGHADWTVLNRIVAGDAPSRIFGAIKADGAVYVINRNGIIFGGSSQINVHSLIASSLDIGEPGMSRAERNAFFLGNGITDPNGPLTSFTYDPADTVVEGDVKVEAGAQITASLAPRSVSPDAGGFVYLFAPNVENDGTINTPAGETMMVAAQSVQLTPNAYYDAGIPPDNTTSPTFRAVGVNTTFSDVNHPLPDSDYPWRTDGPASAQIGSPGKVVNTGLIDAERGVVIMNGDIVTNGVLRDQGNAVIQAGVIRADTSVTRNGQIFLDARLQLTLDPGTSVQILPDDNGETVPLSAIANFTPGLVEMRGHGVDFEAGALVEAPGATVKIASVPNFKAFIYPDAASANASELFQKFGGVYMAADSTIDVSGLDGVLLPMSANFITFEPFGNEFADSPLQRNGALRGTELTVDIRDTGTLNGVPWVGTPLADLTGLAANIQRGIDQLLTTGGTVNIDASSAGNVVLRQGSTINVAGGYVEYQGGTVATTNLLTADGRIVNIANASPLDTYVGVAGAFTLEHPHWGPQATQTFVNPLLVGAVDEPGYIEGHDAGGIVLNGQTYVLDGSFYAGAIAGERQRLLGKRPSPATANTNRADPNAMPSAGFFALSGRNNLVLEKDVVPLDGAFALGDPVPADRTENTEISTDMLSQGGFGKITANFTGSLTVASDADLTVAAGGSIGLTGGSADIEGALTAHSGSIAVEATALVFGDLPNSSISGFKPASPTASGLFDLTIGSNAVLDASGEWVNDAGAGPEALAGGAYVDGGSVTLKTDTRSASCETIACTSLIGLGTAAIVDLTGSIVLAEGSLLDVSSGGRIANNGKFQLDSKGRPAGRGGNVALQTYVGTWNPIKGQNAPPTTAMPAAGVVFAGSLGTAEETAQAIGERISAFGFSEGGTLTIRVPTVNIGGTSSTDPGTINLPDSFFSGNAFGGYNLSSVVGGVTVAPNTALTLQQRNFVADPDALGLVTTGEKVADVASVGFLPDILRSPVNLQLAASLPGVPFAPYQPSLAPLSPTPALDIGPGVVIQGDPGAAITLSVTGRRAFIDDPNNSPSQIGNVPEQTAVADIEGSIVAPGGAINLSGGNESEIWLGENSLLDVSGVAITDARQPLFRTGTVLPGGTVSILASDASASFVGVHGATIDVSGATGTFDFLPDGGGQGLQGILSANLVPTLVWSDAGSISISGFTVLYDGEFKAQGGSSEANGGSLSVFLPQKGTLTVREHGGVTAGLAPTDSLGPLSAQTLFFADSLAGSGIASLTLSAGSTGTPFGDDKQANGNFSPGTILFDGTSGNIGIGSADIRDPAIHDLTSLYLDASSIQLAGFGSAGGFTPSPSLTPSLVAKEFPDDPNNTLIPAECTANVCLNANYVALLGGAGALPANFSGGNGIFRAAGNMIDIAVGNKNGSTGILALVGVADADLVSTGDIRLRVPLATVPPSLIFTPPTPSGELVTAGDLTFAAAQVYPMSDVDFTLKSTGADSTITFLSNGTPATPPLSAAGQLTVSAAHIDQEGTLLAPLGTIRLGAQGAGDLSPNDPIRPTFVPTMSVTLGPGSVTSVSLAHQIVPFGETANGADWSYNSQAGSPLGKPLAKNIVVNGASIDMAAGATVDISGGGDIQAMEFVKGTGGSRDVLANDPNVFAIIPGYNPAAAPVDLDFLFVQGDALPAAGAAVFLSGGGGLPAGYYTLLPAHYATLPGAYRVKLVPNTQDALVSNNVALQDGTMRMAGYLANPGAGTRSGRTVAFDVQSSDVWRLYSEIDQTSGNAFFGAQQPGSTAAPPRLPRDAGHFALSALGGLNIAGLLLDAPDAGGRGAWVDIAALDIQILSPGGTPLSGYVGLDALQLTNLGADSLLIGGTRTDGGGGEIVSLIAHTVELSNDASSPLEAPEIVLATGDHLAGNPPDPGPVRGIRLDEGSVIRAAGEVAAGDPTTITMGDDANDINGGGSLLSVSTGAPLVVHRQNVHDSAGKIDIRAGAVIEGGNALTLDSTSSITVDPSVTFSATNISVGAKNITFGNPPGNLGFEVSSPSVLSQLEQAQTLALHAINAINFEGGTGIAMAKADAALVLDAGALAALSGGAVTIDAGTVTLVNSGDAEKNVIAGNATLQVNAGDIVLGSGQKALTGFGAATFSATHRIAVRDNGSLDEQGTKDVGAADVDLTFQTPLFLVGAGAQQTIATSGAVSFADPGPNTPAAGPEIGGTFTVNAASIADNTLIQALAGGVTLHAASGDIALGSNAEILANGFVQTFFDVTRVASGGVVRLIADGGNIAADAGAKIDVSSAAGRPGSAGTVELIAPNAPNGTIFDPRAVIVDTAGDGGGTLKIDAQALALAPDQMCPEGLCVPSLFSDTVNVHVRQGNLDLGHDLTAQTVTLTADIGVLTVDKTIDASGAKGGTISLFGGQGVTLASDARLLATASDPDKRGGDVVIGAEVAGANGSANDGIIDLQTGSVIDVSNTANSANGGTVRLRAPLSASGHDVAINPINGSIVGASGVTVEAFKVFDSSNGFNGVIDPIAQPNFYGSCTGGVCTGTLTDFVQNFSLSNAAQQKFASISPDALHLQPGIELVSDGDITVASNWNLGAGTSGFLVNASDFKIKINNVTTTVPAGTVVTDEYGQLLPQYASYKGDLLFVPGLSQITELYYRVGGSPTGEPGTLTLRAARDLVINASISDGFFQTQNRIDTNYLKALRVWLQKVYFGDLSPNITNGGGMLLAGATYLAPVNSSGDPLVDFITHQLVSPPPVAPYDLGANAISPVRTGKDQAPIAGADLFPLIGDPNGPIQGFDGNYRAIGSWSYNLVGGSDTTSANPLALRPLSDFADGNGTPLAGHGNVVIDGHAQFSLGNIDSDGVVFQFEIPTIVRTGTGSIDIAAARDFILADTKAPGVVYTAGRSNVALPDPNFQMQEVADPFNPGGTIKVPVAQNPTGFLNPQVVACDPGSDFGCEPYGPITAAAYPVDGGHLTVTAQQDILGFEHPTMSFPGNGQQPNQQYFAPWLYSQSSALSLTDFGVFAPRSAYLSSQGDGVFTPAQTSWWINFGSFDQGLMSVGGDVRIEAGRDIRELGVSLPTTARVSGGLSNTIPDGNGGEIANIPVLHLNKSGDLTVIAGRDILSGAYYEGSGAAKIVAGGSVEAGWTTQGGQQVSTVLAVDTGTITFNARGSLDLAGVVSGASLRNVNDSNGDHGLFISSYGPSSKVVLQSVAGDVVLNSLLQSDALVDNGAIASGAGANGGIDTNAYRGVNAYPGSFEAAALLADVRVADTLELAPSDAGFLDLLAQDSILTFTHFGGITKLSKEQYVGTGSSIVERIFDPAQPLAGFGPAPGSQTPDLGPQLLHQGDLNPDLFYAATGDIVSGAGIGGNSTVVLPLSWEVNKPAVVRSGNDIIDLPFFGQNLSSTDVTQIVAARDILYTGALLQKGFYPGAVGRPVLPPENVAGLSLAGPGFFDIEAGRNLGPFVTPAGDIAVANLSIASDPAGTGIVTFGNTVVTGNRLISGDQFGSGADFLLPREGANIIALFGVGKGADYQAVIDTYVNPATSTSPRSYLPALAIYLQALGFPPLSPDDAWAAFNALSPQLQRAFVGEIFFSELLASGTGKQFSDGYGIVNTLFPASLGYTDNGPNGVGPAQQVATGNLEMLHATIKTLQSTAIPIVRADGTTANIEFGGDILLFGPGGNINVGTTTAEINKKLTNSAVGILTLDGGGINTFTDGNVLVNQSRILTVQGGDVLMWSSNGDLDAGRGAKTTVDYKPLSVIFNPQDLQTINLNGLVSGAGIGTIQSTPDAPPASAFLFALRGTVNAGDAGLRTSGNLEIAALQVLNAANIAAGGTVSGAVQTTTVNLGALESSGTSAGQATKAAEEQASAAANHGGQPAPQRIPSLITVEVLGFGEATPLGEIAPAAGCQSQSADVKSENACP